jgi:hypothetical protein
MGKRFIYHSIGDKRFIYHSYELKDLSTIKSGVVLTAYSHFLKIYFLIFSVCPLLCTTSLMVSLHKLRELPKEGEYFLSFKDLLEVIHDASVKHKFSFRIPHKDPKRAWYRCKNKECP